MLLTVVVPAYNAQDYLSRCVDSLLVAGPEIEVIIVDDGSTDRTGVIADGYRARCPTVRVIHQANGGHGAAINAGLAAAKGDYFKVVDSDDWLNEAALQKVLQTLSGLRSTQLVDLMICNYAYEHGEGTASKTIRYVHQFPQDHVFTWADSRTRLGHYLIMHAVIYRTELLRKIGLKLPAHTFYVDNLFVFAPLGGVTSLYYLNVDLYRYFIGREDQSVNERVMISRIDQQLRVNKQLVDCYARACPQQVQTAHLRRYLRQYVAIITGVSSVLLIREGTPESLHKKQRLWMYIRQTDKSLYHHLRLGMIGVGVNLPGKVGRHVTSGCYVVLQHLYHFN
ncbi:glycosyltransferase family 2 protein [Lacticaseibacillus daqingensis]|uniref:glycosyltransferase family 2 protein n=1 Tax=Lacticaseibacillus daqingensis TaxID=2486014 RepID=UPI000F779B52|nr:glycosyltransferase family 2 protein [Lacticaseibacillus daqingensis]